MIAGDDWDVTPFVSELGSRKKKAEKRKKKEKKAGDNIPNGRKPKRAKLEKVVDWGETDVEDALDVKGCLLKDDSNEEKDDNVTITFQKVGVTKDAEIMSGKKKKQLELSWKLHMQPKETVEPKNGVKMDTPKVKMNKKEALKKAADSSRKLSDWIKPRKEQEAAPMLMDWSDDRDIPGGEMVTDIERKEAARMKKESWMTRRLRT